MHAANLFILRNFSNVIIQHFDYSQNQLPCLLERKKKQLIDQKRLRTAGLDFENKDVEQFLREFAWCLIQV